MFDLCGTGEDLLLRFSFMSIRFETSADGDELPQI